MKRLHALLRAALVGLAGFLALSAIPGGITLLAGFYAPPVEQLEGSVFRSFLVPGLVLLVVVGGSALLAFVLLVRRSRLGPAAAGLAGAFVMSFEFVEVLAIGAPPGPAFVMQVLYFAIGLALVCCSLLLPACGQGPRAESQGPAASQLAPAAGERRSSLGSPEDRMRATLLALCLGAASVSAAAPLPQPSPQSTDTYEVQCTFRNPAYSGTCRVAEATPRSVSPQAACRAILTCLNSSACVTKTYCNATAVRGGWRLVSSGRASEGPR